MSDWGAVYHPVEALSAGNDLAMPGPISGQPIVEAVKEGRLSEAVFDTAVKRILRLVSFCRSSAERPTDIAALRDETTRAAYNAALSGIIMLKNDGELFPLANGKNILLAGSAAAELMQCGSGSAGITTDRTSSLADTLQNNLPNSAVSTSAVSDTVEQYKAYLAQNSGAAVIFAARLGGMEGNDRKDLYLSPDDRAKLNALCALKNEYDFTMTLVLNSCGPVDFSEFEGKIDAVFACFLTGMEGAHALGDIMAGKHSPSGKLPLSFPKRYEDTPTFLNFPGEGKEVNYGEGIYVGYRYYDKKKIRPAYPFGFGMSYTSFEITDLRLEKEVFEKELRGSVKVRNTGSRKGAEVVQIYISDVESVLPKPVKELKFFKKVMIEPNEEKVIEFTLAEQAFASFDPQYGMWLAEEGEYDIIAASSSAPQDECRRVRVQLKAHNQYSYGLNTTVKILYENPELKELVRILWQDNGWDWQIVESNYQYTASRELCEIFPESPSPQSKENFLASAAKVKHK